MEAEILDRTSPLPLWVQLKTIIRDHIERGEFQPDVQLPSETELCARYSISRAVVREALGDLVAERLVYKIKGKGAFVAAPSPAEDFVSTTMSFSREMSLKGRHVTTRVLEQELDAPTAREAHRLILGAHESVVRLRRIRAVDGRQRLLVTSVLPARLVPGLERLNLENASLYDTIRRRYGIRLVRAERWIEATLPSAEEAALLEVSDSTPLLAIESVSFLADGTPAESYSGIYLTLDSRIHLIGSAGS